MPPDTARISVAPDANHAGEDLKPVLLDFANEVSAVLGKPLHLTTGTKHRRMTPVGNISDHWDGHAGDFAMSGAALTCAGQAALIAAGMNPNEARHQQGGLFNLLWHGHRVQIIFNSVIGNHEACLHLGVRPIEGWSDPTRGPTDESAVEPVRAAVDAAFVALRSVGMYRPATLAEDDFSGSQAAAVDASRSKGLSGDESRHNVARAEDTHPRFPMKVRWIGLLAYILAAFIAVALGPVTLASMAPGPALGYAVSGVWIGATVAGILALRARLIPDWTMWILVPAVFIGIELLVISLQTLGVDLSGLESCPPEDC